MSYSIEKKKNRTKHLNEEPPVKGVIASTAIRGRKIAELKTAIKLAREDFSAFLKKDITVLSEEEKKENQKISIQKQAIILALLDDIKATRLNVLGSKYFQFIPSPANRRQRKEFNKENRIQ